MGVLPPAPTTDISEPLLHALTRAIRARRALEIGTGTGESAVAIATALPADGVLITLERDRATAEAARARLAARGLSDRVSVMIGDAARFLHKLAGPFDLIFQDGDTAQYTVLLDRLVGLLAPGGTLVSQRTGRADDYNRRLAADFRLYTVFLPLGDGVAISVRQT